jgi:hypothetical protein
MITVKLLLCAQGVVRDADSQNVSIFNVYESLQGAGFPLFIQQMDVLAVLERTPRDKAQRTITFKMTMGETEVLSTSMDIDFQDKLRNRSTVHIQGLVVPQPGTVLVTVAERGRELGRYELLVEQVQGVKVETHQDTGASGGGA